MNSSAPRMQSSVLFYIAYVATVYVVYAAVKIKAVNE